MSEAFLGRSIKKYFKAKGYKVSLRRIRLGNCEVDGEAISPDGKRIAIEIKSYSDDLTRGIGQLTESVVFKYDKSVLVTTLRNARTVNLRVFNHFKWVLIGVNSKGEIRLINNEDT